MQKKYSNEARKEALDNTLKKLEEGVRVFQNSDEFKAYLSCMAKFHNYSFNNSMLIFLQCPHATHVGSYTLWKSLGRQVNKGTKGIHILAPSPFKVNVAKVDAYGNTILDDKGNPIEEQKTIMGYRPTVTFDISQTSGEPLKEFPIKELMGDVEHYQEIFDAIASVANCPIAFEEIPGGAKGYYSPKDHRIALQKGMDNRQTIKTLIHETIHSKLDSLEAKENGELLADTHGKETRAEACAFVVCDHLGIDTSDYSFPYIGSWSSKELKELREQMDIIRKTSNEVIVGMEEYLGKIFEPTQEKTMDVNPQKQALRRR